MDHQQPQHQIQSKSERKQSDQLKNVGEFRSALKDNVNTISKILGSSSDLIVRELSMSLLLYITAKNFTSIFGLKDYRSLLVPLALISISLQKDIWPNTVESSQILGTAPIIHGNLFGLILPCILCVIGAFRGKKKQSKY
ncbi:hypothetical protein D3C78_741480 [compost metagenome]